MKRVPLMKLFLKGNYQGIRWKDTSTPIEPCSPDEAYTILSAHSSLIPQGVLTYYWHVYDFTKSHFDSMWDQFQFWKAEKHGKPKALAFGYQRFFHKTPLWCSTIYALDQPSFYSTLSHQLQTAKALQAQEVLCFHSLPFQAGGEIPGLKRGTFSTVLVLYEKCRPFLGSK